MNTFVPRAPFDLKARLMTGFFLAIILVVFVGVDQPAARIGVGVLLVVITGAFYIRGYSVTDNELLIHQLVWTRRLPLADLQAATHDPGLLIGSIRTFGIGGVFGYNGLFRSTSLGNYTAYLTAGHLAVVLRFHKRTVVISPADPLTFLTLLAEHPALSGLSL